MEAKVKSYQKQKCSSNVKKKNKEKNLLKYSNEVFVFCCFRPLKTITVLPTENTQMITIVIQHTHVIYSFIYLFLVIIFVPMRKGNQITHASSQKPTYAH